MSINYCTLTSSSVDSFCGTKRAVVLNRLIAGFRPPVPHGDGDGGSGGNAIGQKLDKGILNKAPEKWEQPRLPTELEQIIVRAKFQNLRGTSSQEERGGLELVTVTDIHVAPTEIIIDASNPMYSYHPFVDDVLVHALQFNPSVGVNIQNITFSATTSVKITDLRFEHAQS